MAEPHLSQRRGYYEESYASEAWRRGRSDEPDFRGKRFTKVWYRAVLDYFLPGLQLAGRRVLDLGCGYGFLAPYVLESGGRYVGADLAFNAVRQVPRRQGEPCSVLVANAAQLPVADSCLDVVICLEMIEHLPDPRPLLREIFRVLRPGGRLILSCPNYGNLFLFPKLLADAGVPFFKRYIGLQVIDRTTTAAGMRRLLSRQGRILMQRGARLHPPLFEQLDYRLRPDHPARRINDWIFSVERRWGGRAPFNYLGFHAIFLVAAEEG